MSFFSDARKTLAVGRRYDPPVREHSLEARTHRYTSKLTARETDKIPRQGAAPLPAERLRHNQLCSWRSTSHHHARKTLILNVRAQSARVARRGQPPYPHRSCRHHHVLHAIAFSLLSPCAAPLGATPDTGRSTALRAAKIKATEERRLSEPAAPAQRTAMSAPDMSTGAAWCESKRGAS